MKKIGLIDVDGGRNFPSLPLMKISAWHKAQGDIVEWYNAFNGMYDDVYMSKVFSFSPDFNDAVNAHHVHRGGTGYAITLQDGREVYDATKDTRLPDEIEHMYPDYSLYPRLTEDTAFGFLTRGCPRACDFCHVASKEGRCSTKVADLHEFWNGQRKIVLCDPNILACKDWRNCLQQLIDANVEDVDFNQGLDVRMLTEEKIAMLNQIKTSQIHFAWDRYEDKDIVIPKFKLFVEKTKMSRSRLERACVVYTIVNFNTTIEQDLDRIYTLRDIGLLPYVAVYDKEHCASIYKRLARWVNNRFIFMRCKRFEDYDSTKRNVNQEQLYPSLF